MILFSCYARPRQAVPWVTDWLIDWDISGKHGSENFNVMKLFCLMIDAVSKLISKYTIAPQAIF